MTAAAQGRSNRNRGARAEVQVVNYLRQWWPDARRYLAGDGRQPGDIDCWPGVIIEVRDRAQSSWPSWCAQAVAEAGDRIPVVVRRTRGVPDVGQWETRIRYGGWLELGGDVRDVPKTAGHPADWFIKATFADLCDLIRIEAVS